MRNMKFLEAYASSEVGKETGTGAESLLAAWGFDLGGGATLWSDHLPCPMPSGPGEAGRLISVWGAVGGESALEPGCLGSSLSPTASRLCDPGSVTQPLCFLI